MLKANIKQALKECNQLRAENAQLRKVLLEVQSKLEDFLRGVAPPTPPTIIAHLGPCPKPVIALCPKPVIALCPTHNIQMQGSTEGPYCTACEKEAEGLLKTSCFVEGASCTGHQVGGCAIDCPRNEHF
jgi:hypothetical protein